MSNAYRQSALLLQGLNEVDSQWVLTQLEEQQRLQLQEHMEELRQIGMPADPSLIEDLLFNSRKNSGIEVEKPGHILSSTSTTVISHLLNSEPTWLIAAILSIEPWPWRESIFISLDASRRECVKQAMRETLPLKLRDTIIAQLEARLPKAISEINEATSRKKREHGLRALIKRIKFP